MVAVQVEARLTKQSPFTMRPVIAPKVGGAQNLAAAAGSCPLAFSLLCSSVSAVAGFASNCNYAAANSAMDALAQLAAAGGAPAVAVQWGAWSSVGGCTPAPPDYRTTLAQAMAAQAFLSFQVAPTT